MNSVCSGTVYIDSSVHVIFLFLYLEFNFKKIMDLKLFFATNRNHIGDNRWKPKGYGKKFSQDGHFNLRFGELSVSSEKKKIDELLWKAFPFNQSGDGEELSGYLSKQAKNAKINAYEDLTNTAKKALDFRSNSSTKWFLSLKKEMEQSKDVLIFIHGYNVSWEEAVGSALSLQLMINRNKKPEQKEIIIVLFSWPSDGSIMPFAAYKSDRSDARDSAQAVGRGFLKLRDFIGKLQLNSDKTEFKPCGQKIHLLCHSMGNYVLQNALKKLIGYSDGSRMSRIFDNIFLCAADVDDDVLEKDNKMEKVHELCNRLTIYYNNEDIGMYISDYTKGHPQRLGHTGLAHPQLAHNKIHQVDCTPVVKGIVEHSYYLWGMVNNDIAMTLYSVPFDDKSRMRKRLANNREWMLYY
jgi:esterase/lipase superfamily enzyme